ncbi:hypothetical protein ACKS0A_01912 [Histoplasma ohiense]
MEGVYIDTNIQIRKWTIKRKRKTKKLKNKGNPPICPSLKSLSFRSTISLNITSKILLSSTSSSHIMSSIFSSGRARGTYAGFNL